MSRVVWITGAGKGIGRALALVMARDGWSVAASARTKADLMALAAEAPPGTVHPFVLDVIDEQATGQVFQDISSKLGVPDLAVLNAGTHLPMSADEFSVETLRKLVDVNLMGTANGLAHLLPAFRARGAGHVAVVASVAGYRGLPSSAAYGATKAALINMCEALKPELDREGVTLSLINPGFVKTPLTDRNTFPMPFLVTAEEAARVIYKGLKAKSFEIVFPWPFAILMKLLRLLPQRLLFALTSRMVKK